MEKYNLLIGVMKESLEEIELAIGGYIVMSEELDAMFVALQNGRVPGNWTKVGFLSLKPLAPWFTETKERVEMFRQWLVEGPPNAFWLSGFFFPQGFMTGCLQTHARQHKIPIDKLTFGFEIMKQEGLADFEEPPEEGMYVYGMFMDGARWNRDEMIIDDQMPSVLYDSMPAVWFMPKVDFKPDDNMYDAPLYKTSERKGVLSTTGQSTNFVIAVQLPTKSSPDMWVKRAAALLCNLNE
jgi:dynein heavy chain